MSTIKKIHVAKDFTDKYPNVKHVEYDSISESSVLDAHEIMYGKRAIPYYDFKKAKYILSIYPDSILLNRNFKLLGKSIRAYLNKVHASNYITYM